MKNSAEKKMYIALLRRELHRAEQGLSEGDEGVEISFAGREIDLIEIGMALWRSRCILVDGEPATQPFIKSLLEITFHKPINNWDGGVQDLKRRKNPVAWLTTAMRQLQAHLEKLADDRPGWK